MSRGIHVFGSASIGALRAAELLPFGMEGVGAVFDLYRDGILVDDDEVAVAHGPAETGFVSASEAMVNIRQTLRKAERLGVISTELRVTLEKIGKSYFIQSAIIQRCCGMQSGNGSSASRTDEVATMVGKPSGKSKTGRCASDAAGYSQIDLNKG